MDKNYLVFDARYNTDTERSAILLATNSYKEAKKCLKDYPGSVIVEDFKNHIEKNPNRIYLAN